MPTVTDKDHGYKALGDFIKKAGKVYVVAGIRGEKGAQREPGDAIDLVGIATVNEFGSENGHVPERSFLRSTFDAKKGEYEAALKAGINRAAAGESTIDHELETLGVRAVGDVVTLIRAGSGIQPANAPRTIAAKRGSTHTLINTGRLAQSIDSEVRRD